jgi:hypothetical protein
MPKRLVVTGFSLLVAVAANASPMVAGEPIDCEGEYYWGGCTNYCGELQEFCESGIDERCQVSAETDCNEDPENCPPGGHQPTWINWLECHYVEVNR